jgi:hypothetical protein
MNRLTKVGIIIIAAVVLSGQVAAICPVCTVAIGAGLGVSRWLGISDLISATWIGALLASVSLWTIYWATKRRNQFKGFQEVIFAAFYLITIVSLWIARIIGLPGNTILGVDKIIAGITFGTAIFIGTEIIYEIMRKNKGKALFPFQKVVMPLAVLALASLIFYLIGI